MESSIESLFPLSYLELPVRWTTFGQKIEAVGLYSGAVLYEMRIRLSVRLSKVRNAYSVRGSRKVGPTDSHLPFHFHSDPAPT